MWHCEAKGCGGYVTKAALPKGGHLFECRACGASYGNTRNLKKIFLDRWKHEKEEVCGGCGRKKDHAVSCPLIQEREFTREFLKKYPVKP